MKKQHFILRQIPPRNCPKCGQLAFLKGKADKCSTCNPPKEDKNAGTKNQKLLPRHQG